MFFFVPQRNTMKNRCFLWDAHWPCFSGRGTKNNCVCSIWFESLKTASVETSQSRTVFWSCSNGEDKLHQILWHSHLSLCSVCLLWTFLSKEETLRSWLTLTCLCNDLWTRVQSQWLMKFKKKKKSCAVFKTFQCLRDETRRDESAPDVILRTVLSIRWCHWDEAKTWGRSQTLPAGCQVKKKQKKPHLWHWSLSWLATGGSATVAEATKVPLQSEFDWGSGVTRTRYSNSDL